MTISTLPAAPAATDAVDVFDVKAFAFCAALQGFVTETNAVAVQTQTNADITAALALGMALPNYAGTSTTSLTIGTGAKSLTTQTGKSWVVGQIVVVGNGAGAYMKGAITGYTGSTLDVSVTSIVGSGTFASWSIGLSYSALAASGANNDITSMTGLSNGGIPVAKVAGAAVAGALGSSGITGAAASGANTDISSINGVSFATKPSSGSSCMMVGSGAGGLLASGSNHYNTFVGPSAGFGILSGMSNVCVGYSSGAANITNNATASFSTFLGTGAQTQLNVSNVTAIGQGATGLTGDNQVQIGNSSTTTYVYGTVQNRSDIRDKADVRDTVLGLDFINALRPVDYRWDMRDFYKPGPLMLPPLPDDSTDEEKELREADIAAYAQEAHIENIVRDGSKKRKRFHHGLIAQEVQEVIDASGVDFGGFQDHKMAGGVDVLSIGYDELIAPLIKAVQQLSARVVALEARR